MASLRLINDDDDDDDDDDDEDDGDDIKNKREISFFNAFIYNKRPTYVIHQFMIRCFCFWHNDLKSGAIIGDGDHKSWDARGPMIWDKFSIFRTNCAILTSYIRANPRTCRGFSRGCCHVAGSNVESC